MISHRRQQEVFGDYSRNWVGGRAAPRISVQNHDYSRLADQVIVKNNYWLPSDKTFIGWIRRGFDFLGYGFTREGLQLSGRCKERWRVKIIQLYE